MSKVLLLSIVLLIVVGGIVTATYLWLSKREERRMKQDKYDHEERIHLDDLAFDGESSEEDFDFDDLEE